MADETAVMRQIPGITQRQLYYWTTSGYVRPLDRPAGAGSGYAYEYSPGEVRVAALMMRLTKAGLTVKAAHAAAREIVVGRPGVLAPGVQVVVADTAPFRVEDVPHA